jgi:hypothetical protein
MFLVVVAIKFRIELITSKSRGAGRFLRNLCEMSRPGNRKNNMRASKKEIGYGSWTRAGMIK